MTSESTSGSPFATLTISVLVATHRRPEMLRACLESLCHQTLRPMEVIVVENGPQITSEEVVASFKDRLPVRYLYDPVPGVSRARNTLVRNATGEIVAFIDDCEALPRWLERLVGPFRQDPRIGVVGGEALPHPAQKGTFTGDFVARIWEVNRAH